ncbi:MAG: pilus assembly protein PilP [Nitrospirae bacterium]|nr:pilus assembly protein PilP [Nitrospirota bacterium]
MKFFVICCCALIIILFSFYACSNQPSSAPQVAPQQSANNTGSPAAAPEPEAAVQAAPDQAGYLYEQRDRRDPFVPLILPKKSRQKGEGIKAGFLESYDISEFTLAAIAMKGKEYFALLITPDNKSFTVTRGNVIGMNKGTVKDITKNTLVIVEYTRDYKGELKPRQIILEFHKGEVE